MDAIMTGSFDPITLGHIEVIKKARRYFEHLYVVALLNDKKEYMFSLDEKKELMQLSLSDMDNVIVDAYDGLTADYMHQRSICKIIRGIRSGHDFEYEKKLADIMRTYDPDFDTLFITAPADVREISSTFVKEKLKKGEDISKYVSKNAVEKMIEMYNYKKK